MAPPVVHNTDVPFDWRSIGDPPEPPEPEQAPIEKLIDRTFDSCEIKRRLANKLGAVLGDAKFIEPIEKTIRKIHDEALDRLTWDIKDEMAGEIAYFVAHMANEAIAALLKGNEKAMRGYLNCQRGGYDGRSVDFSDLHGSRLYNTPPIELRRQIVEAHRDLIANERIKDLEKQVSDLVAKVIELRAGITRKKDLEDEIPF